MPFSPQTVKLGKFAPRADEPKIDAATVLDQAAITPRPWDLRSHVASWPMYANDRIGDCAIAGPAHMIQAWRASVGDPAGQHGVLTDQDVITAYTAVSGYDPSTGANDNGCYLTDVLRHWRDTGIAGHRIAGWVAVDPTRDDVWRRAGYVFGGLLLGWALPISAQGQTAWHSPSGPLTGDRKPGSWGGHATSQIRDNLAYAEDSCSWGSDIPFGTGFRHAYCDEAYGIVATDWLDGTGRAPNGLDQPALEKALKTL